MKNDLSAALRLIAPPVLITGMGLAQPQEAWVRHFDGSGGVDSARAVVALADGGAAIAGLTSSGGGEDALVVRYDSDGKTVWSDIYDGPAGMNDGADCIGADSAGNVYVAVDSFNGIRPEGSEWDIILIKYGPDGQRLWERLYDGPANWNDHPEAMEVDAAGNVHIASFSMGPPNEWNQYFYEFVVLKYDPEGTLLWEGRIDGNLGLGAGAVDVAIDPSGNVYATGQFHGGDRFNQNDNILTAKWSPNGKLVYAEQYDSGGFFGYLDEGKAITADAEGNAYVAGNIYGDGILMEEIVTLKYDPAGQLLWAAIFSKNDTDIPYDILVDDAGNVYTGGDGNSPQDADGIVISYDPDGNQRWLDIYDEPGLDHDFNGETKLELGDDGAIWAAMITRVPGTEYDFGLTRYSPDGQILSRQTFDLGSTSDLLYAFDLGPKDAAFMAGYSYFPDTASDAAIGKYVSEAQECYADFAEDGVLDLFDFLGYVNSFNGGEDHADCTLDGALDLFDFLCFVNAFNAGC
jgi:antitoxin component YwqK of YwqJK toxin-antitoxin module